MIPSSDKEAFGDNGLKARSEPHRPPDWVGLGGQRSGTNWMIANLHEHPQIYAAPYEVNYFHKDEGYDKGPEWYCRHWENAASEQLVGEGIKKSRLSAGL